VHSSVSGIASAATTGQDATLVELLRHTIAECRTWFGHEQATLAAERWQELGALTRA
jgi:hypothetical protein